MKSNWKTTVFGVLAALEVVAMEVKLLFDADPGTNPNWNAVVAIVLTATGLVMAKDNDK